MAYLAMSLGRISLHNDNKMFYYISVIAYIALAPLNIPVIEKGVTGLFPDRYLCETYRAQIEELVSKVDNAELTTSKCIENIKI